MKRAFFYREVRRLFLFSALCAVMGMVPPPASAQDEPLPLFSLRTTDPLTAQLRSLARARMLSGCKVAPLPEIEGEEALAFEKNAEVAAADVEGLAPDAAQALAALREMVTSLGGTFVLKSAYRPPAYQAHLHEVWMKWVKQLRGNRSAGCSALREEVGAEFARHQLLLRQQPVPSSDHTSGVAFDAAVSMPRVARLNGKRVTVDRLAAMAGIRRPNSRRDPVHFKVLVEPRVLTDPKAVPERPATVSLAQSSNFLP